jgi:hypothetical protein
MHAELGGGGEGLIVSFDFAVDRQLRLVELRDFE